MYKLILAATAAVLLTAPLASAVKADEVIIKEHNDKAIVKERPAGHDVMVKERPANDDAVVRERMSAPHRDDEKVIIKDK